MERRVPSTLLEVSGLDSRRLGLFRKAVELAGKTRYVVLDRAATSRSHVTMYEWPYGRRVRHGLVISVWHRHGAEPSQAELLVTITESGAQVFVVRVRGVAEGLGVSAAEVGVDLPGGWEGSLRTQDNGELSPEP